MALLGGTDSEYPVAGNAAIPWSALLSPFLHSYVNNVVISFLIFAIFDKS